MNYGDEIQKILNKMPAKFSVTFALHCVNSIKSLLTKEGLNCLNLVEKWLIDETSVHNYELYTSADAAFSAAHALYAASLVTNDAAHAAYAAFSVTNAAKHAAYAAYRASYDSNFGYAAFNAAHYSTVSNAAGVNITNHQVGIEEHYKYLVNMIENTSKIEKII